MAETLRRRSMYVTSSHVIASRELETEKQIMDDVLLAILELQKVISDKTADRFYRGLSLTFQRSLIFRRSSIYSELIIYNFDELVYILQ